MSCRASAAKRIGTLRADIGLWLVTLSGEFVGFPAQLIQLLHPRAALTQHA